MGGEAGGHSALLGHMTTGTSTGAGHVTSSSEEHDSHMMEGDAQGEAAGGELGRAIQVAVKLPGRTVRGQFHTKAKVQVCVCVCVCVCGCVHECLYT